MKTYSVSLQFTSDGRLTPFQNTHLSVSFRKLPINQAEAGLGLNLVVVLQASMYKACFMNGDQSGQHALNKLHDSYSLWCHVVDWAVNRDKLQYHHDTLIC